MPELAFVIFDEEQRGRLGLIAKSGLFKTYIGTFLFHRFKWKKFKNGIHVFKIEVDTNILLIKLPFQLAMLSILNRKYLERYISRVYSAAGCKKCFVPSDARKLGGFEQYSTDANSRSVVFKALLLPILNEIYLKSGLRLDNLDMAFVNGENSAELLTMVKQLEPYVKYITVASSEKEAVEDVLSDICADSGICIFVGSDIKNILRNAELIINLGKAAEISRYRIRPSSLVVNYSCESNTVLKGEYTAIMGVEYTFQRGMYDMLGEDIQRSFSREELTEILMAFKTGLLYGGSYNDATATLILDIYINCRCSITGFNGRRGVLRVENV